MPQDGITLLTAFVCWLVAGIIVGSLYGVIMGTGEHGGFLEYMLLGIVGAIISGIIYSIVGSVDTFTWQVFVMVGTIGAILMVVLAERSHRHHATKRPKK